MIPTLSTAIDRTKPADLAALGLPLCVALFFALPASAQHVEEVIPEAAAGFTLEELNVRGPAAALAIYSPGNGETGEVQLALAHGETASELHGRLQRVWSERQGAREVEIDGLTFESFVAGSEVVVLHYADHRLLMTGGEIPEGEGNREALETRAITLLEAFEPGRIAEWTPPASTEGPAEDRPRRTERAPETTERAPERPSQAGEMAEPMQRCGSDMECFLAGVSECAPVRATVNAGPSVGAMYRVDGSADGGACRISFRFTENPNPELVDSPLFLTVDPDAATAAALRDAVQGCLVGTESAVAAHHCEGPLVGAGGG